MVRNPCAHASSSLAHARSWIHACPFLTFLFSGLPDVGMTASSLRVRPVPPTHEHFTRRRGTCTDARFCLIFSLSAVPERLNSHPNNQRPPLIDSEVLHSLNTSGALVMDAEPAPRILALAQRCCSRDRSAVIVSNNNFFSKSCKGPSDFHVLSFHISGSSFSIIPKLQTNVSATIDSILMPIQTYVRRPSHTNCINYSP